MADRVEDLLARLAIDDDAPGVADARALVARALELGASDDEIIAAGRRHGLGPLTLDLAMRSPGPAVTLDELAETSGLDRRLVQSLWLALGFPEQSDVPLLVTADVAEALQVLAALETTLGEAAMLGLARVIGSGVARMADALANASRVGLEVPQRASGTPYAQVAGELAAVARAVLPPLCDAIGALLRRHLVLVAYQTWQPDDAHAAVTVTRTVGFVDLVGSTEMLRAQSVAEIAASVDHFEQLVWDVVSGAGGRVVKLIGDEAMFVEDPVAACRLARSVLAASPQAARAGLAYGEIVALHGDCYGPTVNLAARLVEVAAPGAILVSEPLQAAAAGRFDVDPVETGPLRGFPAGTSAYRVRDL